MGPLSAIAVAFWLLMFSAAQLTWWTVSANALGCIGIVVMALVLLDAFFIGSGARWVAIRSSRQAPPQ